MRLPRSFLSVLLVAASFSKIFIHFDTCKLIPSFLVWADNADACSVQYAGTGALKTDFTRYVNIQTSLHFIIELLSTQFASVVFHLWLNGNISSVLVCCLPTSH